MKNLGPYLIVGLLILLDSFQFLHAQQYDEEKTNDLRQYLNELVKTFEDTKIKVSCTEFSPKIKKLIEEKADPNAPNLNGKSAIHWAAEVGEYNLIKFLLSYSADIEAKNADGWTSLACAARYGHQDAVAKLIEWRANIETMDDIGRTPIRIAAFYGHQKVLAELISSGANLEAKDSIGWTALTIAATRGRQEIVAQLIRSSADVEAKSECGSTPLMFAAMHGHQQVVALLINSNADIEAKDNNLWTPLMFAARKGDQEIVAKLIGLGANANHHNFNGNSALSLARYRAAELLSACFSRTKLMAINQVDELGLTSFDVALANRNIETILLLLSHGADPLLGRFNGLCMASRIREWQKSLEPENGLETSLYDKIYEVPESYYLTLLAPLFAFEKMPMEVIKHIIKWILAPWSFKK